MNGFTLIEILVSITLTAIIIVSATGIWISCTRGWTFARQHERTTGHDDMVTSRVKELFERAMLEKSSRDLFEWKCDNQFDGSFPADRISFTTRWPVELEQGRTMLVPVRGSLGMESVSAGRNTGKRLTWSFGPFSGESREGSEPESVVFSSEIQSLNIRYWWKDAGRWLDDWREEKQWPNAIEVELTFADSSNPPRQEKFVVALPEPADPAMDNPEQPAPETTSDAEQDI
jgi:prepilin-type N-terminal cleavage/methylation domain-containing protein